MVCSSNDVIKNWAEALSRVFCHKKQIKKKQLSYKVNLTRNLEWLDTISWLELITNQRNIGRFGRDNCCCLWDKCHSDECQKVYLEANNRNISKRKICQKDKSKKDICKRYIYQKDVCQKDVHQRDLCLKEVHQKWLPMKQVAQTIAWVTVVTCQSNNCRHYKVAM